MELTMTNLAQKMPEIFGPDSLGIVGIFAAEITKRTEITVQSLPGAICVERVVVPYGNFGLGDEDIARYSCNGAFIHMESPNLFSLAGAIGIIIQRVKTRRDMRDLQTIPRAMAERVCLELLAPRQALEVYAALEFEAAKQRIAKACISQGMGEGEARKYSQIEAPIKSVEKLNADDFGRASRFTSWRGLFLMDHYPLIFQS